jgi:hypothetical protein
MAVETYTYDEVVGNGLSKVTKTLVLTYSSVKNIVLLMQKYFNSTNIIR